MELKEYAALPGFLLGVKNVNLDTVDTNGPDDAPGGAGAIGTATLVIKNDQAGIYVETRCPFYAGHSDVLQPGCDYTLVTMLPDIDGELSVAEEPIKVTRAILAMACRVVFKKLENDEVKELVQTFEYILSQTPAVQKIYDQSDRLSERAAKRAKREREAWL